MKYILILIFILPFYAYSQNVKQLSHGKKSYVDSTGRYFQNAEMPVYLMIATAPNGDVLPLKSIGTQEIKLEGNGVHAFKHENVLSGGFDEFHIYADGIAPQTRITLSNALGYEGDGRQYYAKGLELTLSASDNMSGVEKTYFSLSDNPFGEYVPHKFSEEGAYNYFYYSVDKTGNVESLKSVAFTIDVTPPETFHNFISISSQNIISTNSSIYLTVSDKMSGVSKIFYRFDQEEYKEYNQRTIPFKYLADGEHRLYYYSIDQVGNKETEKSVGFYLDKTAPIMSADVLGDKFLVGERVYFSGRTKLKLTAIDNKSGIKEVTYSINGEPHISYTEPFYLPNRSGVHNVKFKAIDNKNNAVDDDFEHSVGVIYVDLTGPTLSYNFVGSTFNKADTIFISPKTKITIKGVDPESGLQKLSYSLDGSKAELDYTEALVVNSSGFHTLDYFGYDNVSNRNAKSFYFVTDVEGPQINAQFATPVDSEGKYPSYTTVYLAAVDEEVGANLIKYKINGGKEQIYAAPLRGFGKNKKYTLDIIATDMLGNESKNTIVFETGKY